MAQNEMSVALGIYTGMIVGLYGTIFSGSDWKTKGFYGLQKTTELDIDSSVTEESRCFFVLIDACVKEWCLAQGGPCCQRNCWAWYFQWF